MIMKKRFLFFFLENNINYLLSIDIFLGLIIESNNFKSNFVSAQTLHLSASLISFFTEIGVLP